MSLRRLLLHALVLVAVAAMITAGFWQLNRLGERRDRNATVAERRDMVSVDVASLLSVGQSYSAASSLQYRPVVAEGVFEYDAQVLIRNRTYRSSAGFWVLTPLRLASGTLVAVNRGWVPFGVGNGDIAADYNPPAQVVKVQGVLRATVTASGLQQADPADGVLTEMSRPDLARLSQQLDADLLPAYIQLASQVPPTAQELPIAVPLDDLTEGSHLTYAVQWFLFATVTAVGYPLILRRLGRVGDSTPLS